MSKEKETKVADVSVENIDEVINNGSTITKEIADAAAEELAKRRKEQKTRELTDIIQQADYTQKRMFLNAKKAKKIGDIKMNYLKKYTELHNRLKSGDATLSIPDFRKQVEEEKKTADKLIRDVEKWFDDHCSTLSDQYPGCWSWTLGRNVI